MLKSVGVSVIGLLMSVGVASAQSMPSGSEGKHAWQKPSPEEIAAWHSQMCTERYAREAGRLEYLEAKLVVTEQQKPAFDRWRDERLSAAASRKDECLAHMKTPGQLPDAVERNAREQERLEARLKTLRAERPALEALYAELTPDQKKIFDSRGRHFGHRPEKREWRR